MEYFSSERKLINHIPTYTTLPVVLPHFTIRPYSETYVLITVFIPTGPNEAEPRHLISPIGDLPSLFQDYINNPEHTLSKLFNFTPPTPNRTITLEDLGL